MGPTGNTHVVQIHLTRRCNLRCLHCYSSSSPEESEMLGINDLMFVLDGLAEEGYHWISLSGGEPLLYPELSKLLSHAQRLNMKVALVSNGMLLTESKLSEVADKLDLLVLSIDGKPESHNRMRGSERAFHVLASRLEGIRRSGIPFGFIFTLTQHNLDELPWVADFALNSGGQLLQIHPLGNIGSALSNMADKSPDAIEARYAWALCQSMKNNVGDRLAVQLDYMYSEAIKENPSLLYADKMRHGEESMLSTLVSPLIIEPDGELVPFQFGFSREFSLGNIKNVSIRHQQQHWKSRQWPKLQSICQNLFQEINASSEPYFVNWYQELTQKAQGVNQNDALVRGAYG